VKCVDQELAEVDGEHDRDDLAAGILDALGNTTD
jgi:hypothetical protein